MALILVAMAWYSNSSKRNKIYCSFTRINKTSIHKFVKMSSRYVVFDSHRYDIVPSCVVFDWWDKGLVNMLFPQWVATLSYVWNNRFPNDPTTNKPVIISPEVRNAMNKEEWVKSYAKGFTPPSSKKGSFIQQYLPWISIVLILLVGVYVFTNMKSIAMNFSILQNQINALNK